MIKSTIVTLPDGRKECQGICRKTKSPSEFGKKDGVCKECRKEIADKGLKHCDDYCDSFKPLSEFAEPGLCKECKNMLENWFDYYCGKDHCRELNIKEIVGWLRSLSNEIQWNGLKSDGSSGNDTEIVVLIRHLMIFILYRMHYKGSPMDVVGKFSAADDFAEICRDVAEHFERLQSHKGENVSKTESVYERNKAAVDEEMCIKPKDRYACECGCGKTQDLELVYKKTLKKRKKDEPLCECFGSRKGCTYTSIIFPNSEKSWIRDKGSLYDREGNVQFVDSQNPPCRGCNAAYGKVHHVNCDVEKCPKCNEQILTCKCNSYIGHIFRDGKGNEYTRHQDFYKQFVLSKR